MKKVWMGKVVQVVCVVLVGLTLALGSVAAFADDGDSGGSQSSSTTSD